MTGGTDRSPGVTRADIPFAALALGSWALLLYLGRSLTFYWDEWAFITFDGGLVDYLRPHNEHWSTLPLMLYRATFGIVGLRSYLPYLAEVDLLHILAVAGAYAIARARVGPVVATLVAFPLLLLGSGSQNLFWAFQTGFVASVMFGVWSLFFIERADRRSPVIASALLVGSLMSSGIGLVFLVAAGVRTTVEPSLRRRALAVAPPALVYLVWFALIGHDPGGDANSVVADPHAIKFAARGLVFSINAFLGFDRLPDAYIWGLLVFVGLFVVTGLRTVRTRQAPPSLALACLFAIGTMYTLIALVRAHLVEQDFATQGRYVYVASFFLTLAVVDLLPRRDSWPRLARRTGIVAVAGLGFAVAWAIVVNVDALSREVAGLQYSADVTRAFVELATRSGDAPWIDEKARSGVMPRVFELREIVSRHGSPLEDDLVPGVVHIPGTSAKEAALLAIVGNHFSLVPAKRGGAVIRLSARRAHGVNVSNEGRCLRARFSGVAPALTVVVPESARVRLVASTKLTGHVYLGHEFSPSRPIDLDLAPGVASDITVPDVGDGRPWQVGLEPMASRRPLSVCAFRPERADSGGGSER